MKKTDPGTQCVVSKLVYVYIDPHLLYANDRGGPPLPSESGGETRLPETAAGPELYYFFFFTTAFIN
jgi:hypothetical protein